MDNIFHNQKEQEEAVKRRFKISETTWQIIVLAVAIFLFRILYVDMYVKLQESYGFDLYDYIYSFLTDYIALIPVLVLDIIFSYLLARFVKYGKYPIKRYSIIFLYLGVISVLFTFVTTRFSIAPWDGGYESNEFLINFLAVLLLNVIIVIVGDLIIYFRRSRMAFNAERDKKRKAQFQYQQLKQQYNPHFLFNCLNNLDNLVQEGDKERACDFIRKLAGLYRYLLSKEDSAVVPLNDELEYISMYSDLLKERFSDGFEISVDIPDDEKEKMIVPYSLQLLIENATKHNIANKENPLKIDIYTEGEEIIVRNNLQPRLTVNESIGLGLSNIQKQYASIVSKEIVIEKTGNEFIVKLPLLKNTK